MANIKITVDGPLMDGHKVTFKAPCDCTRVDKLDVRYVKDNAQASKLFTMKDSHGNDLTGLGNLFAVGAYVDVVLDTVNGFAYLQNAATNGYLESKMLKEDADYPGCYYRHVNGVIEWENPPMENNEVYRTTKRHYGKPVYVQSANIGEIGDITEFHIGSSAHSIDKIKQMEIELIGTNGFHYPVPSVDISGNVTTQWHVNKNGDLIINTFKDLGSFVCSYYVEYTIK